MFHSFHGVSSNDVWLQIAGAFRDPVEARIQTSRAGGTREIFRAALTIEDPRQRWVLSRSPPINPAFALAEVVWILAGRNDSAFLTYFNRSLPSYCGAEPQLHGAYGYRLRRHFGFDQLGRAANALEKNRDGRQVALQIWDCTVDLPYEAGIPRAADIPCNMLTLLKIREGKLELTEVLRSNDVFRGLPYNLVQFTTLQEVLAGWIGVGLGTYGQVVDSLHVYDDAYRDVIGTRPVDAELNTDDVSYPKALSDRAWAELATLVDRLIRRAVDSRDLARAPGDLDLPVGYRNIASVLCAEVARRANARDAADEIMEKCSNAVLRQLWNRWTSRVQRPSASDTA